MTARTHRTGKRAFTLVELLVVIVIGALILSILAGALSQAQRNAKRARAETELRELTKAWMQYWMTYGAWPSLPDSDSDTAAYGHPMTYANLRPIVDVESDDNKRRIAFLSIKIGPGQEYLDPWKHVYRVKFNNPGDSVVEHEASLRVSVEFPNRNRYR
jgi:prepilin-type N-terminal cleavage/methylation domain-containing protein